MSIRKTTVIDTSSFYEEDGSTSYTIVGTPTIDEGVFKNLNYQNYINLPFFDFKNKAFSYSAIVNFTTEDLSNARTTIFGQDGVDYKLPSLVSENGKPHLYYSTNGTAWAVNTTINTFSFEANKDYCCEFVVDLSTIKLKINSAEIYSNTYAGITYDIGSNKLRLGGTLSGYTNWNLKGSIKNMVVKISDKIVWTSIGAYLQNSRAKIGKNFVASNTFYEV